MASSYLWPLKGGFLLTLTVSALIVIVVISVVVWKRRSALDIDEALAPSPPVDFTEESASTESTLPLSRCVSCRREKAPKLFPICDYCEHPTRVIIDMGLEGKLDDEKDDRLAAVAVSSYREASTAARRALWRRKSSRVIDVELARVRSGYNSLPEVFGRMARADPAKALTVAQESLQSQPRAWLVQDLQERGDQTPDRYLPAERIIDQVVTLIGPRQAVELWSALISTAQGEHQKAIVACLDRHCRGTESGNIHYSSVRNEKYEEYRGKLQALIIQKLAERALSSEAMQVSDTIVDYIRRTKNPVSEAALLADVARLSASDQYKIGERMVPSDGRNVLYLEAAARSGDPEIGPLARMTLGDHMKAAGELASASDNYLMATEAGLDEALLRLARLAKDQGNADVEIAYYNRAAESSDAKTRETAKSTLTAIANRKPPRILSRKEAVAICDAIISNERPTEVHLSKLRSFRGRLETSSQENISGALFDLAIWVEYNLSRRNAVAAYEAVEASQDEKTSGFARQWLQNYRQRDARGLE